MRDGSLSETATGNGAGPMRRRSVLIFDSYFATLGGNQRYICMLMAAGRAGRWHVALACPGEGRLTEAAMAAGGQVHIQRQPRRLDRGRGAMLAGSPIDKACTALALLVYNLRLVPLLRRLRPDALQCHSTRNALMAGLAARIAGVPMILFVKGAMDTPLLDRIAVRLAHRTIFLCGALKPAWMEERTDRHVHDDAIVRIGIEFDDVDAAEARVGSRPPAGLCIEPGTVNFAFAGWLVPGKGAHTLIEAFGRAVAQRPECRLHVIGTSNDETYVRRLQTLADRHAPPGTIRFLGWRDDVLDILAAIDVFVLPSFTEGVPRSIVEAMALGKAVIATRVGGVPELLGHGDFGMMVEPGDVGGLAELLVRLAMDRASREEVGRRARAEARSRYSFDAHVVRLWQVLDSVSR